MDNRPIGVFDSGVGGLTVLKQLDMMLPGENFIYFGDTARVPYGEKTPEHLLRFVREIMEWFKSNKVKAVVMACNTSSAVTYEIIKDDYDFPVFSLIEPTARYVSYLNVSKIGVLATSATVNSHAYSNSIKKLDPAKIVLERACPGLVELVESNKTETQEARRLIIKYVVPFLEQGVERIILGCTHYPYLRSVINEITGDNEMLIDPAKHLAEDIADTLFQQELLNNEKYGTRQFFASSNPEMFREAGKRFYPEIDEVRELNLSSVGSNT
ncbi:MAG: glutamate racemase [Candidatus Melainabacteria bacterium GWF2_37_15]|nr:MAG: glutamate racemase [Candidatus Melainabacteria bacterium GWF2_37_15]